MKRREGYTLVEIMIAVALLGIIITISIGMLLTSLRGQQASYAEYDLHSNLRAASLKLTNIINESTAVFSITEADFAHDESNPSASKLTPEWDYYGILAEKDENGKVLKDKNGNLVGSKLIKYEWVAPSAGEVGYHKMIVLADSGANSKFSVEFKKPYDENTGEERGQKFIAFDIHLLEKDGKGEPVYTVSSELEAKNANQVVFRNTDYERAVAIAVRTISNIEIEEKKQQHMTFVHMVFDVSSSMDFGVDGQGYDYNNPQRIAKLRDSAKKIIDKFAENQDLELVIYPFSTTANYPSTTNEYSVGVSHPIYRNQDHINAYFGGTDIKSFAAAKAVVSGLEARGGTNVADAFRRVYHKILFINGSYKDTYYPNAALHHYVIFLMDGQPTMICMEQKNKYYNPYYEDCIFLSGDGGYKYNGDLYDFEKLGYLRYLRPYGAEYQLWCNQKEENSYGISNSHAQRRAMEIYPELLNDAVLSKRLFGDQTKPVLGVEKVYFIGFSTVQKDNEMIETIARNSGLKKNADGSYANGAVFKFDELGENADLYTIFQSIAEDVLQSKWIIEGPGSSN